MEFGAAATNQLLIGDVFTNAARAAPNRVAAALGADSLTFGDLEGSGNQIARALSDMGVGPGDRVVTYCATALGLVPLFAGAAKLGAVFAPVNPALGREEAAAVIGPAKPGLVVVDQDREQFGRSIAELADARLVVLGDLIAGAARQDDAQFRQPSLTERHPHVVFFTSGSTGRPKGAVISHRTSFLRTNPGALLEPRGAMVCPYPLFHMGAWTIALQQWQARDRVVLVERADAPMICDAVAEHRATRLNCVPAVWRRLLDHLGGPGGGAYLSSVRFADTGTSATPVELLQAIGAALPGAKVRVFYGSTEAGGVTLLEDADIANKPGSCGVPGPLTQIAVDEGGELLVRGPLVFDGYFDDPEATAAAFDEGWYKTGDLADVDDEGYLTIVGRARDVVRSGGETIVPAEVEAVLGAHAGVADVAVVGLPDERWGEVVCAVVVASAVAQPPTLQALRDHCAGRLAPFKHPRRIEFVDHIPRTSSTQQVQRRLLVEMLS